MSTIKYKESIQMNLKQLLEGRGLSQMPVTLEFEQEVINSNDEAEYRMLTVVGTVETELDPYGTGDSPTDQSFEITSVCVTDTGEKIDPRLLTDDEFSHIQDLAIQKM